MNPIIECIKNRRSCRSFKHDQLKDQEIEAIINAGIWAPSGNNKQPWYFTVIRDYQEVQKINRLSKENAQNYLTDPKRLELAKNESFDLFYGAPVLVIISGDPRSGTMMADCSAAIQNMLLAAESLNIGSLWNGIIKRFWFDTDGVKNFIEEYKIPEEYQPVYAVAFGYPSKESGNGPSRREGVVNYLI